MVDYEILNKEQKEAMLYVDGPLLILAGAGSGKTRVLTYRIAHLINDIGINPSRILALTFTNKAANEMKDRLSNLGIDVTELWIGTFHSICARLLRIHGDLIGYTSSFSIYDMSDQYSLIRQIMRDFNISDTNLKPNYVKSIISDAKNKFISPDKYFKENEDDFRLKKIAEIYKEYDRRLSESNSMDFDDLLAKTILVLRNNKTVSDYYKRKFQFINVDEYQDTNLIQYILIKELLNEDENICVVGDNDQSIYGWRGADIRNIIEFEKDYKGAKVVLLEQNYRSTKKILNLANSVIKNNSDRKDKKLWTENSTGEDIVYCLAGDDDLEAQYVATKIIEGVADGADYDDFAVLYRTNAQSERFESAFNKKAIPYKIIGGLKFFDRKEIKDLLSYLKFIVNQNDESAFVRIINEPKRSIGRTSLDKILKMSREKDQSFLETLKYMVLNNSLGRKTLQGISQFLEIVIPYIENEDIPTPSEILKTIIDKTGYLSEIMLEVEDKARSKSENIQELVSQVMNYEVSRKADEQEIANKELLSNYVQEISLVSDADNIPEHSTQVLMMTLHTAKGLEYENVFLVGMEDSLFPSQMSMDEGALEEERRLCYVGITRAMKKLYITRASNRRRYGRLESNPESRFMKEMDLSEVENVRFFPSYINGFSSRGSEEASIRPKSYFSMDDAQKTESGFGISVENFVKSIKNSNNNKNYTNMQDNKFKIGERVRHSIFGSGEIVDILKVDDEIDLVIIFDKKGEKRLSQKIAKLKKL